MRGPDGRMVPQIDAAQRREAAAQMRSKGASWQRVADEYYRGNLGNAHTAVKRFWADMPKETVEEIRSTMLAKVEGLEAEVREVMARPHYLISEGHIVRNHQDECDKSSRCGCPVVLDDEPIYRGVDRVRALIDTQLRLIPGLAAPTASKVDQTNTGIVEYKITTVSPEELEQL